MRASTLCFGLVVRANTFDVTYHGARLVAYFNEKDFIFMTWILFLLITQ